MGSVKRIKKIKSYESCGCLVMDKKTIDIHLKKKCVDALNDGASYKEIYDTIFYQQHPSMSYETFRHKIRKWKDKNFADEETLCAGTYQNFVPHDATVQVNGNGEVVQAWIKQKANEEQWLTQIINAINENTEPVPLKSKQTEPKEKMLEINLADMHFGLPNDYSDIQNEIIDIIRSSLYEEINIIIGQDLFHNDDFRGRTSKGTQIEKIDMEKAWEDAKSFWYWIIKNAIEYSGMVKVTYVKGNHDESISWAFVQMLKIMFPTVVFDDSLKVRKALHWKGCFVGLTHGAETMSKVNDLRGQFTIAFPKEFADANVREIHCSHLHHEKEADVYGVMIRRLSTANVEDEWSDNSGFIGSNKRFMMFEFSPNKLKVIYYLYT